MLACVLGTVAMTHVLGIFDGDVGGYTTGKESEGGGGGGWVIPWSTQEATGVFDWPLSRDLFPGVMIIGTTTIIGHVFLTAAFQTLPIILVSIVITLVPAVQEFLAFVLFGDDAPHPAVIAGGVMILGGILVASVAKRNVGGGGSGGGTGFSLDGRCQLSTSQPIISAAGVVDTERVGLVASDSCAVVLSREDSSEAKIELVPFGNITLTLNPEP